MMKPRKTRPCALVASLVTALAVSSAGAARVSLPDLGGVDGPAAGVGVLTWPLRFALWGIAPLAEEHDVELDELRVQLELQGAEAVLGSFRIHEAAEEGVVQTLQGDVRALGGSGPWMCRLRVVALVDGHDLLALPLSSPPFLLRVPGMCVIHREGEMETGRARARERDR
jgi:hypothetical protein